MREVFFDKGLNGGAGAPEMMQAQKFIGNELKVGRRLEGQKLAQECDDMGRPRRAVISTAGAKA